MVGSNFKSLNSCAFWTRWDLFSSPLQENNLNHSHTTAISFQSFILLFSPFIFKADLRNLPRCFTRKVMESNLWSNTTHHLKHSTKSHIQSSLNASRDIDSTISLGSLFLTTIFVKKFLLKSNLNFSMAQPKAMFSHPVISCLRQETPTWLQPRINTSTSLEST